LSLFGLYMREQPAERTVPVAGTPRPGVTATGVVQEDPQKGSPSSATPPVAEFDPRRAYGDFVRNTLVDAMIDNSGALQVRPGERLTIRARVPQLSLNPLSLNDERELLLSVLADDLLAFRQGQIDKAEIRRRIKEYRY
jgi:hypothetical protein